MRNEIYLSAKHGLREKTWLKAFVVLEWPLCQKRFESEGEEKARVFQEEVILV